MSQPGDRTLKVGIELPVAERKGRDDTPGWADILEMAQLAEQAGFDSLWVEDHLLFEDPGEEPQGVWECWSLLAALAASTSRVELAPLVSCATFRNPALTAKMADTVDEISDGRLILGLGAGWNAREYSAFGFPFDHRVGRFEEALQIIHALLRTGQADFEGKYFSARECELRPRGPRPEGPPILLGTIGERMLGLTAKYADMWNAYFSHTDNRPEGIRPLQDKVDAACRAAGRDPSTLARTATILVDLSGTGEVAGASHWTIPPLCGSSEEIAAELRAYQAEGVSHIQLWLQPNTLESVERFAPVLELLR